MSAGASGQDRAWGSSHFSDSTELTGKRGSRVFVRLALFTVRRGHFVEAQEEEKGWVLEQVEKRGEKSMVS